MKKIDDPFSRKMNCFLKLNEKLGIDFDIHICYASVNLLSFHYK